ncbi:MAG: hypothetical protein V3R73_07180 [Sphingomonadales bacterium]
MSNDEFLESKKQQYKVFTQILFWSVMAALVTLGGLALAVF